MDPSKPCVFYLVRACIWISLGQIYNMRCSPTSHYLGWLVFAVAGAVGCAESSDGEDTLPAPTAAESPKKDTKGSRQEEKAPPKFEATIPPTDDRQKANHNPV